MKNITDQLKIIVKSLLEEKKVMYVIGYETASIPYTTKPVFIENVNEVEKLIWNEYCSLNLVSLIPDMKSESEAKIGLVLKTCDIKSLIILINEKQIKRNQVYIIGVPCTNGVVDRNKIQNSDFKLLDVISESCMYCIEKTPKVYDVLIDVEELKNELTSKSGEYKDVIDFEKKTREERWKFLSKELEKCTKCFACRDACPLCYCKECFVDLNQPQWFNKTNDVSENILFHLTRAIHLAGRCVDCGACTRSCPEGIDIHVIYRKLRQSVKNRWGVKAGSKIGDHSPLGTYNLKDPQEFIVEED